MKHIHVFSLLNCFEVILRIWKTINKPLNFSFLRKMFFCEPVQTFIKKILSNFANSYFSYSKLF